MHATTQFLPSTRTYLSTQSRSFSSLRLRSFTSQNIRKSLSLSSPHSHSSSSTGIHASTTPPSIHLQSSSYSTTLSRSTLLSPSSSLLHKSFTPKFPVKHHPISTQYRSFFAFMKSGNHARIIGLGRQINNYPAQGPGTRSWKRDQRNLRARRFPKRFRIFRNRWFKMKLMFDSYHKSHSNIQDTLDAWDLVISPQWRATRYNAFFRIVRIPKPLFRYYEHRNLTWLNREFDQKVRSESSKYLQWAIQQMPLLQRVVDNYPKRKKILQIWAMFCFGLFWTSIVDPGELAGQEAIDYMASNSLEMVSTTAQILHQHDVFHFRNAHFYNGATMLINRAVGRGRTGASFNTIEDQFKFNIDNFIDNPHEKFFSIPGSSHRQFLSPYILDTLLHVLFCRSNIQLNYPTGDPYTFLRTLNTVHVRTMAPFKPWKANTPNAIALTQDYNFKINFFRVYQHLRKRPTITRDLKDLYSLSGKTMEYYYDVMMEEMYHDKLLIEYEMLKRLRTHVVAQAEKHGYLLPPSDISSQSTIVDLSDPRHALAISHLNYLTKGNAVAFPLFPGPIYEKHYTETDRLLRATLPKPGQKHSGWVDAFNAVRLKYSTEMFRLLKARHLHTEIIDEAHQLRELDEVQRYLEDSKGNLPQTQPELNNQKNQKKSDLWKPTPTQNLVMFQDKVLPNDSLESGLQHYREQEAIKKAYIAAQETNSPLSTALSTISTYTSPIISWFTPSQANAASVIDHTKSDSSISNPQNKPESTAYQEFNTFEKYMIYNTPPQHNQSTQNNAPTSQKDHHNNNKSVNPMPGDGINFSSAYQSTSPTTQNITTSLFGSFFADKASEVALNAKNNTNFVSQLNESDQSNNSNDTTVDSNHFQDQINEATTVTKTFHNIPQIFPTITFQSILPSPIVAKQAAEPIQLEPTKQRTVLITNTNDLITISSTIPTTPSNASSNTRFTRTPAPPSYKSLHEPPNGLEREYKKQRNQIANDIMTMQGIVPELYPRTAQQRKDAGLYDEPTEYSTEPPILISSSQSQFIQDTQTIINTTPDDGLMPTTTSGLLEKKPMIDQRDGREIHSIRRLSDVLGLPEHVVVQTTAMTLSELLATRLVLKGMSGGVYNPYDDELNQMTRSIDMDLYMPKRKLTQQQQQQQQRNIADRVIFNNQDMKKNEFVQSTNALVTRETPEYAIPSQFIVERQFDQIRQSGKYDKELSEASKYDTMQVFDSTRTVDAVGKFDYNDSKSDTKVRLMNSSPPTRLNLFVTNIVGIHPPAHLQSGTTKTQNNESVSQRQILSSSQDNLNNDQDQDEDERKLYQVDQIIHYTNATKSSDYFSTMHDSKQQQLQLLSTSNQTPLMQLHQSFKQETDFNSNNDGTDTPHNKFSRKDYFAKKQQLINVLNPNNPIAYDMSQHVAQSNVKSDPNGQFGSQSTVTKILATISSFFSPVSTQSSISPQSQITIQVNEQLTEQRRRFIPILTPLSIMCDRSAAKFKLRWTRFTLFCSTLHQDFISHPQFLKLQSFYLSDADYVTKQQMALQYRIAMKQHMKEDLVNGVVSDRERYRYDYLSSLCARLDVCMLQIQFELKRIHHKPTYITHPEMTGFNQPTPLDDFKYQHLPEQKSWGDGINKVQDWNQNEEFKKSQITYV